MKNSGLGFDSNVAPADSAFPKQATGNEFRSIDSNGKAESLGAEYGRGVDSDNLASGRYQRTTGVSGVQRSIRLDDIFDQTPGIRT
ncbi:MAG TPA: hypothetical protein VFB28_09585 [Terriglobales bacterium]|nr:hypothetical protein [Terriglobales bacterium]